MNPPRKTGALKPLDAQQIVEWVEPLYVQVFRSRGAVPEQIIIPPGDLVEGAAQPGMGYSKANVLALPQYLMENHGPGVYTTQLVDANNKAYTWSNHIGSTAPAPPQPPAVPLGAGGGGGRHWQPLQPQQPQWAPPQWPQSPPWQSSWNQNQNQNQNMIEVLLAKLLDKDKEQKQNDPIHLMMMMSQQQSSAFEQRMAQWQSEVQHLMQAQNAQRNSGLDFNKLIEVMPVLLPIILPFLKRDDGQHSEIQQLRMEAERERHRAELRTLEDKISSLQTLTQNGKNSEFLPLIQMLQQQHTEGLRMLEERQRSMESKAPGLQDYLAMFQAMKPQDSPVIDGLKQLLEISMSLNSGGERSIGEQMIDGFREITSKLIEAKTAAATAQALSSGTLSGPPQQPAQRQPQIQKQAPNPASLLATLQEIQKNAAEYVSTEGVSGISPEEVALHIDQIAQELSEGGFAQHPLLVTYRQGCERIDRGETPNEFWSILTNLLPQLPQSYVEGVFRALEDLRRGGEESEQGGQGEASEGA